MTNAQRKTVNLSLVEGLASPSVEALASFSSLRWAPFGGVMSAQDTIAGTARRVIARVGLLGSEEFPVDDALATSSGGSQNYPESQTWRRIWGNLSEGFAVRNTPGTQLEAHILYVPSGMTQEMPASTWEPGGAGGAVRVRAQFDNGPGGSSTLVTYEEELPPLPSEGAVLEVSDFGAAWAVLEEATIIDIRPPDYLTDQDEIVDMSEWSADGTAPHEVLLELEARGGARLVEMIVYEVPIGHGHLHDAVGQQSVHAYQVGAGQPLVPQTPTPQESAPDGDTYGEGRFGTHRCLDVAEWQALRLGPQILNATPWVSSGGPPFDVDPAPWSATAVTTPTEIINGNTAYDDDRGSWIVAASYAKLHDLCEPDLVMAGGTRAMIPVRLKVVAEVSGGGERTGWVRVQSSDAEWVDIEIPHGALGTYSEIGYLESQVHPDHVAARCQVFIWTTSVSDTIDVHAIAVEFGEW